MDRANRFYHFFILFLIIGYYLSWSIWKFETPLTWQSISAAGVAIISLLFSLRKKISSALMFFFSAFAMVFAVLYWPLKNGQSMAPRHSIGLDDLLPSTYFFVFFLIFGYLYWFNRNRWE